jgi:hypothetical protein
MITRGILKRTARAAGCVNVTDHKTNLDRSTLRNFPTTPALAENFFPPQLYSPCDSSAWLVSFEVRTL